MILFIRRFLSWLVTTAKERTAFTLQANENYMLRLSALKSRERDGYNERNM
jgi:hypothetical protein